MEGEVRRRIQLRGGSAKLSLRPGRRPVGRFGSACASLVSFQVASPKHCCTGLHGVAGL